MRPRPTIRLRLTALYALVVFLAGGLLLGVSYALLDRHLHDALTDSVADTVLHDLRGHYVLALFATTAIAVLLGWLIAGRALSRLRAIASAASAVSGDSLNRRIGLDGPDDELRELARTFDDMLERLDSAFVNQKRFVANASHELRSPLTVLRTEVEVALADPDAGAEQLRATIEAVRDEVVRFEALLNSLLTLARGEARALGSEQDVDLGAMTRAVVGRLGGDAGSYGVRLTAETEPVEVRGDPRLLEQLVFNLVENAVEHNCEHGFAHVEVARRAEEAVLEVANSGPRLSEAAVALLTEPFHRLDQRRTRGGAGVGLSIVHAVAAAHGGRLELGARADGGLTAEVLLPAATAEPRARARRPGSRLARSVPAAPPSSR